MQHFTDVFGNLPVILAIALFIGIVVLVRLLLSPNSMERRMRRDRRHGQSMPELPFYDSERNLVTRDRRAYNERRKRAFIVITKQRRA